MLPFDRILATRPDPLGVLESTAFVVTHARQVRIDRARIERVADLTLANANLAAPAWNYDYHFFDARHPTRSAHYIFLLDALNFCFWIEPKWSIIYRRKKLDGYWALAAALKRAAQRDAEILNPRVWAEMSPDALAKILGGQNEIPLFVERWRNVRELGRVLVAHWNGDATNLVRAAKHDAAKLAQLVADNFSSFADAKVYRGREIKFYKRAQILVGDLFGSFGGKSWGKFDNLAVLTCFADYKLPQILRVWGVLHYSDSLARRVDAQRELAEDSAEEIEIRAATIWAVEFLREALRERGKKFMSVQVDWFLWETSQTRLRGMKPYHRVRTIFY